MYYIYKITNQINSKVYVGQTNNMSLRWSGHKSDAMSNINRPLYNAMRKYGTENFTIEIIEEVIEDLVDEKEIYWINQLNCLDRDYGYNLDSGGNKNKHASLETRQKQSDMRKGKNTGKDNSMFGKHHTPESRLKISKHKNNKGEHNPRAILTKELVEKIKQDTRSERKIAKEYGVSRSTINSIKRGINWSQK